MSRSETGLTRIRNTIRWISLVTVMLGVSLVGYSGSLIKDAVKDASMTLFRMVDDGIPPPPVPTEDPEVTKVVVGS